MAATLASSARRRFAVLARVEADRRRHKRYGVPIDGRFMPLSRAEHPCRLIDISAGGLALETAVPVEVGERVIAYLPEFGGLQGRVARLSERGFALALEASPHKRAKLADQIMWLINRHELDPTSERRHSRVELPSAVASFRFGGAEAACQILDVSLSGASLETDMKPPVGTEIALGKLRARVMRHHLQGVGVQFLDIQEPEALRRHFG